MIQVKCQCGKTISAPDDYAGRKGSCKKCGAVMVLPSPASTPPPPIAKTGKATNPDETLYSASPSMFRNHPIRFVLGIVIAVGYAFSPPKPGATSGPAAAWILIPTTIFALYVVWWLRCRAARLTVTPRKVTLRKGILSRRLNEVRISDIRNVVTEQGFLQRMLGVGSIGISTAGQSDVEIKISGIPDPQRVRDIIDERRD